MILRGVRRSESDTAQKSCPMGAPARAAAVWKADTPGTTRTAIRRAAGSGVPSRTSMTSEAMA